MTYKELNKKLNKIKENKVFDEINQLTNKIEGLKNSKAYLEYLDLITKINDFEINLLNKNKVEGQNSSFITEGLSFNISFHKGRSSISYKDYSDSLATVVMLPELKKVIEKMKLEIPTKAEFTKYSEDKYELKKEFIM